MTDFPNNMEGIVLFLPYCDEHLFFYAKTIMELLLLLSVSIDYYMIC